MNTELRAYLIANAGLSALVSTRVFFQAVPQGTADPYIRISAISAIPEQCHDTALASTEDACSAQLDGYGSTAAQVQSVRDVLRPLLLAIGLITDWQDSTEEAKDRWRVRFDVAFSPADL